MASAPLIIIYNHQYNKNIEPLEELYKDRFDTIIHLVPFYEGSKSNVIPVYENSYYFQGYVAQAARHLRQLAADHYLFIGDDLLLNPNINQENYASYLKLDRDSCFVPEFIQLHAINRFWHRCAEAVRWSPVANGLEILNQIPSYDVALSRFEQYGLSIKPLSAKQVHPKGWRTDLKFNRKYELSYPLVGGYSDIFAVSSKTFDYFSHLCGTFAAANLFVELAIPTAMALSASSITNEIDTDLSGKPLWTEEDYKILTPYKNSIDALLNDFPEKHLYLHPVKLSQWKPNNG